MNKELLRIEKGPIGGVCEGFGKYFEIDPVLFRLLFCIGVFTPYPTILLYLIFWIAIPKEKILD
jgi:phage shock protein PspC (stress-responsive transcriptional regulator)